MSLVTDDQWIKGLDIDDKTSSASVVKEEVKEEEHVSHHERHLGMEEDEVYSVNFTKGNVLSDDGASSGKSSSSLSDSERK